MQLKRRTFLGITGAGLMSASYRSKESSEPAEPAFRTSLSELLGIEYPVLQSGMGRVAGPELAAEVSKAGGLGILAGLGLTAEQLRQQIQRVRELTDRPFGVNLWLHTELRPPLDPTRIPEDQLRDVQSTLNRFRDRMGLPTTFARPRAFPDLIDETFQVVLEERPALWSIGLGDPGREMVDRCRERGIKVMAMVASVEDARRVAASEVDLVVAQGAEAGGHRSTWVKPSSREAATIGGMALVPQIVDAVDVPVIAAGGITDGRGLVAALALGAVGVLLGTRFVATRESMAPEFWKKALMDGSSDHTTVTDAFTGLYARTLRNRFSEEYAASSAPVLPGLLQAIAAEDIYTAAAARGDAQSFPLFAGQSVGLIDDLPGAADVVHALVREARDVMQSISQRVSL